MPPARNNGQGRRPAIVPSAAASADLQHRLRAQFGQHVTQWSGMAGGRNNRLFHLTTSGGPPLVAKFYHQDRWDRLGHEFGTLAFLGHVGASEVPRAYVCSAAFAYGVYSFEPGSPRPAADLRDSELVATARLAAHLHTIAPASAGARELPRAIGAALSVAEHVQVIDDRLRDFETFAASPSADDELRAACRELDLRATLADLVARATSGLTPDQSAVPLPPSSWRLNTTDFGPHNLLVTEAGQVTAVDFEGAGWDDPARLVMGFVAHAATEDLSPAGASLFLGAYAAARGLPGQEIERFERVGRLCDIEWVAIYATALTPEAVAAKQFANPEFDPRAHRRAVLASLRRRLTRAAVGSGYHFSAAV